MPFTSEQKEQLEAPLLSRNVASRTQSGRALSYIEGWHAIAEANRIFGYHSWVRRTIRLEQCASWVDEKERARVSFLAIVEIVVSTSDSDVVVRQGTGTGHGIDKDPGLAVESAAKEAETDAMKRALMTFGNQFGLALYDKEQSNVSSVDLARIQEFRDQVDTAESVADLDKSIEEYREDIIELKIKRRLDWSQLDEKVRARRVELSEEKEK
jgi:DNA recombination protein Rad52